MSRAKYAKLVTDLANLANFARGYYVLERLCLARSTRSTQSWGRGLGDVMSRAKYAKYAKLLWNEDTNKW